MRPQKPIKNKGKKKKGSQKGSPPFESLYDELPGFMYIAEISEMGFHPLNSVGGFASLTGYRASDFFKPDFFDTRIVETNDTQKVRSFREAASAGQNSRELAYHLKRKNGKRVLVKERMVVLSARGEARLIGGVISLASEQKAAAASTSEEKRSLRLQEIQRMNDHLLEINRLKDEFLTNTSHELRTPLNSIIGFLTLLAEGYYESENEMRLFTRNALESSRHLLNVINDILDISKIEAGTMDTHIEKVYVDELMEEIRSLFEMQAEQKGLTLECTTKKKPIFAAADIQKLKQVLINLVGNAIKFTPKGTVKLTARVNDDRILFVVRDTGIGIPVDKLQKVFQKFIQVDGSATRRYGGTGLGLAISKHLVEMMGGKIEVKSKGVGTGTTVRLAIPCWKKE
ncbi:MAG: HAMP domain-containing histidine kinase [Bacteroidetes bacterium]|nr:HAMP domain-containing histidine kinase [Bacteroidota bacterium]MCL5034316.1 HAMP domain-containing histidine kinase [Bacteroidota bacterium]